MTTIIAIKKWDKIDLLADKRTSAGNIYKDDTNKILLLWDTYIAKSWDSIHNCYVKELYDSWLSNQTETLETVSWCICFMKYLKENSNIDTDKTSLSMIFINKKIQVAIDSIWQIEHIDDIWYLSIWSWSNIVDNINTTMKVHNWTWLYYLEYEDIYEIVSSIDNCTSKDFNYITKYIWTI